MSTKYQRAKRLIRLRQAEREERRAKRKLARPPRYDETFYRGLAELEEQWACEPTPFEEIRAILDALPDCPESAFSLRFKKADLGGPTMPKSESGVFIVYDRTDQ